uniref:Uncharacterized protein n=1 Tax=Sphingobacterium sp. (strain 21) TaxID=743722 RepID=F4C971_SPHS2
MNKGYRSPFVVKSGRSASKLSVSFCTTFDAFVHGRALFIREK